VAVALVVVGLAVSVLWTGDRPPRRPPGPMDPARETVVFLGDSITSGHGLPLETTFSHRLGVALGIPVLNAGISGDTTEGGLRRLRTDVLAYNPKLVIVELGLNDIFRGVPRERTIENLRAIAQQIRKSGAGTVLVHISPQGFAADRYLQEFRALARSEGARLVEDFLDGVVPQLTTDGLHPNAEGHARLATRLEPILQGILRH